MFLEDLVIVLAIFAVFLFTLCVGGFLADFIGDKIDRFETRAYNRGYRQGIRDARKEYTTDD